MREHITFFQEFRRQKPWVMSLMGLLALLIIGSLVFHLRYPYNYTYSNFYAEDGKYFVKNLIDRGPILASFSLFNGYLIVGQYIVGFLGEIINYIFGHGFTTLAKAVVVASYLFLAFTCSLPWLLFRKRIGCLVSLMLFGVLLLTPLGNYDYAVIGTIGNLKFAFLFIATLLVLYRNDKNLCKEIWQFTLVDIGLLLCVMTNIVSVGLLPLLLLRYKDVLVSVIKRKEKTLNIISIDFASVAIISIISLIYVILTYIHLHQIPKMTGYLDGPLQSGSLITIFYRSSLYGILFPINYLLNNMYIEIILLFFIVYIYFSKHRIMWLVILYSLCLNVIGFVYNRPGVTSYFTVFNDAVWPGLFFYAGTMLFMFGVACVVAPTFNRLSLLHKVTLLSCFVLLLFIVSPAAGNAHVSHYQGVVRPTLASEVYRVCNNNSSSQSVSIRIYPTSEWAMTLKRGLVCKSDNSKL